MDYSEINFTGLTAVEQAAVVDYLVDHTNDTTNISVSGIYVNDVTGALKVAICGEFSQARGAVIITEITSALSLTGALSLKTVDDSLVLPPTT